MLEIKRMSWECVHDERFSIDRPEGYEDYLILFVKSKAYFVIGGERLVTEPGTFILFNRRSPQIYGAVDGEKYINAWMEFEASEPLCAPAEAVFDKPIYVGDSIDVSQYFRLISDCYFKSNNRHTESHLLKALLSEVFTNYRSEHSCSDIPHSRELLDLRQSIYSHPELDWSVEGMAETLHISKPYFQELYKTAFGVTCMADVINSRIETAKSYLCGSGLSVDEIGCLCGYKSTVHFSRQFKQITGISPSKWKRDG
ncbi:MAG: AraC family transcriptional regulator [Oscillospiraceae bacterium]